MPRMRHSTTNAVKRGKHGMRGADVEQGGLFSYVSMEQRVPRDASAATGASAAG